MSVARVGILALQGDVREHEVMLHGLGAETLRVRRAEELEQLDGLIIPGGESTTIGKLATLYGLMEPLKKHIDAGLPTYGTCAGLILLAERVTEGTQPLLGILDVTVERNAFGNQNDSFEAQLTIDGLADPFHAVFIRAPWVAEIGSGVDVLATWKEHPVMIRQGNVLASAFHPELTNDERVHQIFLSMIEEG